MRQVGAIVTAALATSIAPPAVLPASLRPAGAGTALVGEAREYRTEAGRMVPLRADPLTITVPGSVNLGSGARGGTLSASMGTVTVADSRGGVPPWTATVSATNFTTGSGTPTQTITTANVAYWSGPVTASSGPGTRNPGQATAAGRVALTSPVVAFSGRKQAVPMSTSWQPTVVITIPSNTAAGVYTGTITHSVA
ncbi:hypothetical protein SAMN05421833_10851 [Microbispora rosea]|uniref:WxL domain surface cell wall-binding n=1 Tax=Microbispora rosea TaxID=58117 RepID=A0A1N7A6U4_9ACTN|nr:hypothetical protein [Microbispora rosea]GIH48211.1 hypothetical protein Mro03_33900 [Microbispora rosea subsp. rosea]SIR34743.1 hypothetical protein SAMN05421833_10851 [Microbispora rosea]